MKTICTIYLFFLVIVLNAQDPFFSMAKSTSSIFSPGQIGAFDGAYRAALSYRSQWFSFDQGNGFSSFRASADYRLASEHPDYWSFSFDALNDVSGDAKLKATFVNLGAAYTMKVGKSLSGINTLRFGTQLGFGQNSLSWQNLWFGRQYDLMLFQVDYSIDNGEAGYVDGRSNGSLYPNVNIGLNYYGVLNPKSSIEVDFSAHHLSEPNFGLKELDTKLQRKYNLLLLYNYKLSKSLELVPNYYLSVQGLSQQHTIGSALGFINDVDNSFSIFMNTRLIKISSGFGMDALVFGAEAKVRSISFGLAYDIYVSDVSDGNRRQGAFEFHLGYLKARY